MSKSSQIQDSLVRLNADVPTSENLNFGGNVIISSSQDIAVNVYGNDQALPASSATGTLPLEQPQPQPQSLTPVFMDKYAAAGSTIILDNNLVNIAHGGCKSNLFTPNLQAVVDIDLRKNAGGTIIIPKGITATITTQNSLHTFEAPIDRDIEVKIAALTSLVTDE